MFEDTIRNVTFWKYVSIPFVAGFVGWFTNWVAIKLTFRPLEFVGIRPFLGWQGIIPAKAGKMAAIFVDKTMFRLGTLKELFEHMDPDKIAEHVAKIMDRRLEAYTDEVMFYSRNTVWKSLPSPMKRVVYDRVRREMPNHIDELMADIADNIDDLIDFKEMLVKRLTGDKDLLNRLFLESGSEEFKFIVRSGLYFGFAFGLVQLAVWFFYQSWWVLPFFGMLVGYATNWIAINIIFRPLNPHPFGPWTVQGLFLKRQKEVARVWCALVTTEILTPQHIIYAMLYGSRSDRTRALIKKHVTPIVDEAIEGYRPLAEFTVGDAGLDDIRESVGEKAVEVSTDPFDHWEFNRDRAKIIEALLLDRMQNMPPSDFQDLLRPCFQEDEMKLILTGAALGLIAGIVQLVFVFGGAG